MLKRTILIVLTMLVAFPIPFAKAQGTMAKCDGDIALVRVSQIKPTGPLAAFMQAQDAHLAWYRKNGITTNNIYSARVYALDPTTKMPTTYSETEVMTFHVRPPDPAITKGKDQAGWDAFVKAYRDTSDLKTEQMICVPKTAAR